MIPVQDDTTILDDDRLIRRIPEHYLDPATGKQTVSSGAFQTPSKGHGNLSVDIEKLMLANDVKPADFVITGNYVAAVTLTAGQLRNAELSIAKVPLDDNPYHGEVGRSEGGRLTKKQRRELKENCAWLVKPQNI